MARHAVAALTLLLASALPAAGQEDVRRRSYVFLDNNLTIEVLSENAGVLRVVRGEAGLLEVAARAPSGFASFALGGREENELRLTALADKAEYIVVVPEDAYVRVRLPGQPSAVLSRPASTYTWGAQPPAPAPDAPAVAPSAAPRASSASASSATDGLFLSHYSRAVPRSFAVRDVDNLASLQVRFDGDDFRLATSRAVSVAPGRADAIELLAGQPGLNTVISLPTDTRDFRLVLGGKVALEVVTGEVRAHCDRLVGSRTEFGPVVYNLVSGSGELVCR